VTRGVDDLLADLAEAADAAAELVGLGKKRWDTERPLRLAGEAVIGRLGDIATKLPDEVIKATPEIPWREVKGMRIIAAHAYHRIDYDEVWITLRDDVPHGRGDQALASHPRVIQPAPAWTMIMPNTCPNRPEHDRTEVHPPTSAVLASTAGRPDS
jgi:uncharacterized protein with HEPN domain